ncbi:MAG: hypothetical protein LBE21_03685, partial [Pseudomonadales bacterium]|nr:hypothetical protein [Pseudomonadales bacterium]
MSHLSLDALEGKLDACLSKDRHALQSALWRLRREQREGREGRENREGKTSEDFARRLDTLRERMAASLAAVQVRRLLVPAITYPPQLPVSQRVEDIKQLLREHQVVIIAGET